MNARNNIQAPDSIFTFGELDQLNDYVLNGVEHRTLVQSNLRLFNGRFVLTPSANYREYWNFQYEERTWNPTDSTVDTTSVNNFLAARDISVSSNLAYNFFGYYKFKDKRETKFRHVASSAIGLTYTPDINLYEEIQIDTLGNTAFYSPFERSLYREGGRGDAGVVSFRLNNTVEMKRRDKKDTINNSFKSYKLVDALTFNGNYDLLKDSMNLSNIAIAFRTAQFLKVWALNCHVLLY